MNSCHVESTSSTYLEEEDQGVSLEKNEYYAYVIIVEYSWDTGGGLLASSSPSLHLLEHTCSKQERERLLALTS